RLRAGRLQRRCGRSADLPAAGVACLGARGGGGRCGPASSLRRARGGPLALEVPVSWRPEATYTFAGNDLAGTFKDFASDATTTAVRITDLRRIACPPVPAVAAPSGVSRDRIVAAELLAPSHRPGGLGHNDYFMP